MKFFKIKKKESAKICLLILLQTLVLITMGVLLGKKTYTLG